MLVKGATLKDVQFLLFMNYRGEVDGLLLYCAAVQVSCFYT